MINAKAMSICTKSKIPKAGVTSQHLKNSTKVKADKWAPKMIRSWWSKNSGKKPLDVVFFCKYPIIYRVSIHVRWLGTGFLNHQQYHPNIPQHFLRMEIKQQNVLSRSLQLKLQLLHLFLSPSYIWNKLIWTRKHLPRASMYQLSSLWAESSRSKEILGRHSPDGFYWLL